MRNLLHKLAISALCAVLCCPLVDARGRNNNTNGGERERTHQTQPSRSPGNNGHSRPGQNNHNRPGNNTGVRPGQNNNNRPGNNTGVRPGQNNNNRPGNNTGVRPGQNNHNRPGNNTGVRPGQNNHNRPGNNTGVRPGQNNNHNRPGNNWNHVTQRPPQNHRPGPGAPPPHQGHPQDWGRPHGIHFGAPYRPMMPAHRPWAPPMRPAGFHPHRGPMINTILGVTLGTALGITLSNLVNQGYNVTGYVDNAVYVADAMQLNMLWPNATLYYDNGGLSASEFFYSTPYYDMNRYNNVYTRLVNAYGAPYSVNNLAGGGVNSTWWGPGGQFIQLQFSTGVASNGTTRFFTTLSFGN